MSARGVEIAEALKTAFAASYAASPRRVSQEIAVARTWITVTKKAITAGPVFDHSSPSAGSVQVYLMCLPELVGDQEETRDRFFVDYPINVGVAAYLKTTSNADVDPLTQVSQELRDYCLQQDPAYALGIPEGVVVPPQIVCDPDFDAVQTDKLFLSIFTLVFQGARGR